MPRGSYKEGILRVAAIGLYDYFNGLFNQSKNLKRNQMKLNRYFSWSAVLLVLIVASCTELGVAPEVKKRLSDINDVTEMVEAGQVIPGKYIVIFKENINLRGKSDLIRAKALSKMSAQGLDKSKLGFVYSYAVQGFSVHMGPVIAESLSKDPEVLLIEQDQIATISQKGKPGGGGGTVTQTIPWGISAVGGATNYTGTNVAWVIDSGIDFNHPDLNSDKNMSRDFTNSNAGPQDENGHGTHVAGTIAAINNSIGVVGVAAGAKVVAIKVLNRRGSGSYDGVIAGVDYVAANGKSGDVANMSLGGGYSSAVNNAVIAASKNVKFALAAGNESTSATTKSPASANGTNIVTVSAHNNLNNWASFSNFGNPPNDWCAPGVNINSTWLGGGYNTISGTSMATPHVAGLLLLGSINSRGNVTGDPDGTADPLASK